MGLNHLMHEVRLGVFTVHSCPLHRLPWGCRDEGVKTESGSFLSLTSEPAGQDLAQVWRSVFRQWC